jgi:hypothetical protein
LANKEIPRDFFGSDNRIGRQFHALTFVAAKARDGEGLRQAMARSWRAQAASRRSLFRIFPEPLFGSSV